MKDKLIGKVAPGKYVVAVSGGVDSVALLHELKDQSGLELLVVHINHGIRPTDQTRQDEKLIRDLCKQWNTEVQLVELKLGSKISEEVARDRRHEQLKRILKSKSYNKIITAHHKDDIVETMIINLLRGTGRKGLSSLKNNDTYLRPLLDVTKNDIAEYAKKNNLAWNEDSTNQDQKILRNYIRLTLIPKINARNSKFTDEFIQIYKDMLKINESIDKELITLTKTLAETSDSFKRRQTVMLPIEVSFSFLHHILTQQYGIAVDAKMLKQVRNFIHTAKNGKKLNINKNLNLTCDSKTFSFSKS